MKKAQVTVFIILGIIAAAIIFFLIYLKGGLTVISRDVNLDEELAAINNHISSCLREVSDQQLRLLGQQGGYVTILEDSYKLFNDTKISYLCYNVKDQPTCRTRLLLKKDIENQLDNSINLLLSACINLQEFESSSYNIIASEEYAVKSTIGSNAVFISLDYPIRLVSKSADSELSNSQYASIINYPLGDLFSIANVIIKEETIIGEFDPLPYMLDHPSYKIIKYRPYPDKIYVLKKLDSPYIFQFAVQGEGKNL